MLGQVSSADYTYNYDPISTEQYWRDKQNAQDLQGAKLILEGLAWLDGAGVLGRLSKCTRVVEDDLPFVEQEQQQQQVGPAGSIRNFSLAGQNHPVTGIPFNLDGFPDFSSVAIKTVQIDYTGTRLGDEAAANVQAGLESTPEDYTWHHVEDGTTMQLVPSDIHRLTGHTGGFSLYPQQ